MHGKPWKPHHTRRARALRDKKMTLTKIAQEMGFGVATVHKYIGNKSPYFYR